MIEYFIIPFLIYESIMDIRSGKLRLWELVVLAAVCALFNHFFGEKTLLWLLLGGCVGTVMILISFLSGEQIGYGDSILFVALGLGFGFNKCVWILIISLMLAFLWGGTVCLIKRKNMKYKIPFVPFVLVGTVVMQMLH